MAPQHAPNDTRRQPLKKASADLPTLQAAENLGDAAKKMVAAVG